MNASKSSLKLTLHKIEKADAQIVFISGSYRPRADSGLNNFFGRERHFLVIEPAKEEAGSRHAWWLEFSRNNRRERAILGVSAGISQISGVPGLDGVVNIFLFLVE